MPRIVPIEQWREETDAVAHDAGPINPNVFGPAAPIPAACEPVPTCDLKVDYFKVERGVIDSLRRPPSASRDVVSRNSYRKAEGEGLAALFIGEDQD